MGIIYLIVALTATTLGAVAGLGGGVIIKPALDTMGHYNLSTIGILSSFTVLSMATVSMFKQVRNGFVIGKRMMFLAVGSILGGIIGKEIFSLFISIIEPNQAKSVQALILAGLLFIVLFKKYLPKYNIHHVVGTLIIGLVLGTVASFLGIGGGPINVALLCMLLGMNTKEAAVNSIFIILLSQFSKLAFIGIDTGFSAYDLSMLVYMIPGGILGGILGSKLNRNFTISAIEKIFNITLICIILLNIYNAYIFLS